MATSISQAACNAFATFVAARLAAAGYAGATAVSVEPRWPDADKRLPTRAITVRPAGVREDIIFDPYVVSTTVVSSTSFTTLYAVASVDQPLQLDVWATDTYARDDLVAALETILHAGTATSLGSGTGDSFGHGVLVALGDGWTGHADVLFDGPSLLDSPASIAETDYRAVYMGRASMLLTMSATTSRIARLKIRERFREQETTPGGNYTVITLTTSGQTVTDEA